MKFYRGGPESTMPKGTAFDVINYEISELGNDISFELSKKELKTISANNLQWLTKKQSQAREYGKTSFIEVNNFRIIAKDNYGGLLIEIKENII